jgi:uncharacterized protein (TIGR03118 family)
MNIYINLIRLKPLKTFLLCLTLLIFSVGCHKTQINNNNNNELHDFQQVNLVANSAAYAPALTDPTLLNAWGIAWSPTGIAWVNSLSGHVSELYTGEGAIVRPPVNVSSPADTIGGLPTGIVFAGGAGFTLANNQPAAFLFSGVDGVISGWNGAAGNNAFTIGNNSATSSYTGLALSTSSGAHYLYGANFKTGRIDVWDTAFAPVTSMPFSDPAMPSGYAPFNIQAVGSQLFVCYAKVGGDGRDQAGAGLGFVDIFNTDGSFVKRFASRGSLNAPWGVTQTPADFLEDSDMNHSGGDSSGNNDINDDHGHNPVILIGNFGDGHINAYTLDGTYKGQLQTHKNTVVIDGLWSLSFAPTTATAIDPKRLYFTAGPNKEGDGLFGYLIKQ